MSATAMAVAAIPPMSYAEAMALAEVEAARLIDVLGQLAESDWSRPTDCVAWDVKALLSHVLGAMEANARTAEFVRQYRGAVRGAKRSGRPMVDEMTASQVRGHAALAPAEIADRIRRTAPQALRGRRRIPAVLRAVPFNPGAPYEGPWKLGYLVGTIMNRDFWMHRIDLTRATGTELVLTADHDGRIIADVAAEWARAHRQPFTLVLHGPAGGTYAHGEGGEQLELDAVEFSRILSGRGDGPGLLNQKVPF